MKIEKNIKKKLLETKLQKENQLIERKIVESRLSSIADQSKIKNFSKLTESEKDKLINSFIQETISLEESGLLNEQLGDMIKSLFGNTPSGLWQTFLERLVNSALSALGMDDSFLRKVIVSYFSSHPLDAIKSLNDCKLMTKLIVESVIEATIVQYKQSKGISNMFADALRNTVIEALENNETVMKLTDSLSGVVCDLVNKLTGKAKNVVSSLQAKPAVATA